MSEHRIMGDVVQPTIDLFSVQAKQRKLSIILKSGGNKDKLVKIDKLRVQQILINLLQNAIKFSKAGDKITVEIE